MFTKIENSIDHEPLGSLFFTRDAISYSSNARSSINLWLQINMCIELQYSQPITHRGRYLMDFWRLLSLEGGVTRSHHIYKYTFYCNDLCVVTWMNGFKWNMDNITFICDLLVKKQGYFPFLMVESWQYTRIIRKKSSYLHTSALFCKTFLRVVFLWISHKRLVLKS